MRRVPKNVNIYSWMFPELGEIINQTMIIVLSVIQQVSVNENIIESVIII